MCELSRIYGFNQKIKGGIAFYKQYTLFYLAGEVGIYYNLKDSTQKFLHLQESDEFTAMTLSEKHLTVLASKGQDPKITVYDQKSIEKCYTLPNPQRFNSKEYTWISISDDNLYLAAQGSAPSWTFVLWDLEKRTVLTSFLPFRLELGATVYKFAFQPDDSTYIVAIGRFFLRMYQNRNGHRFREFALHDQERSQRTFHSLSWMEKTSRYAVGTSDGIILIFRRTELLQEISLDLLLSAAPRVLDRIANPEDKNVTCVVSCKKGFLCSYGGNSVLCLHSKVVGMEFSIVSSVHIPQRTEGSVEYSRIVQVALNSYEDMLVAATDDGQILHFSFAVSTLLKQLGYETDFNVTLDRQHKTHVVCADTAINTAIHATCSLSTIILWNYKTSELILCENFKDEIRSVSIHPLGINLLIGFSKGTKMYNVLHNKLIEVCQFETEDNSQAKFAEGGQMIAITNKSDVELYSSIGFEKYASFIGHKKEINCIMWKNNDSRLMLSDEAGNIYEWSIADKNVIWTYSAPNVIFFAFAITGNNFYASSSDKNIRFFCEYSNISQIETQMNVTSLLATEHLLLAGTENGTIVGYKLSLTENYLFEVPCHQGSVLNMTLKENGSSLLVTGKDCAISIWKTENLTEKEIPLFDEVLMERDAYERKISLISDFKNELQEEEIEAEAQKVQQFELHKKEKTELQQQYDDVQNQLKEKIIVLSEEKYNLQLNIEKEHLDKISVLSRERDENYTDFQTKIEKENEHYKKLIEERAKTKESYEWQLYNLREDIKVSCENVKEARHKNESRLKELQTLLQKELKERKRIVQKDEEFYNNLEMQTRAQSQKANFKFASDLQDARQQNQFMTSEVERLTAELCYETECSRALDAEFGKKKQMYDSLKKITKHIKDRIAHTNNEILRKESVLADKVAMIKILEKDGKEMQHLSSEADWKLKECKKVLEEKAKNLAELSSELEQLENEERNLSKKLKIQKREQLLLDDKLKATEKNISESTQKLLKVQLLLERYRQELIDNTKDIDSSTALRWSLLRLLDKRVLRQRVQEEVFVGDTDPYMKFCRQRDHYESLINIVLNRKQEIQASFRSTYVSLAKENSDWIAFAEALRTDRQQKEERIRWLETAVELPAKKFISDLAETQKRFNKAYENLMLLQTQEDEEIQKRLDLIGMQGKELQRLHGLIVVDERGKVIRKLGH